jgi:phosphoglycolate phosphatase-like HAD superfamily hydrolase
VTRRRGVLLDVDGTLLDSNHAHARAWEEALAKEGFAPGFDRIRRLIGMGGDKVVPLLTGIPDEDPRAERLKKSRGQIFRAKYLPRLRPFPVARALLMELGRRRLVRVVASSATADDLTALLEQGGFTDQLDTTVSGDDVDRSKPDPDIVATALERAQLRPDEAVLVGDTPYDVAAARRAGVDAIAVRSGGWSDEELEGAIAIVDDVATLHARLNDLIPR